MQKQKNTSGDEDGRNRDQNQNAAGSKQNSDHSGEQKKPHDTDLKNADQKSKRDSRKHEKER